MPQLQSFAVDSKMTLTQNVLMLWQDCNMIKDVKFIIKMFKKNYAYVYTSAVNY